MKVKIPVATYKTDPLFLGVDSEFNGGKRDIKDLEDYFLNSNQLSIYQVAEHNYQHFSFRLQSQDAFIYRTNNIPYGFFQSNLQKNDIEINYYTFIPLLQNFITTHVQKINLFYKQLLEKVPSLDQLQLYIEDMLPKFFDLSSYHPTFRKILVQYLSQKPLRGIGIIDIEPIDKRADNFYNNLKNYFEWQEVALQEISNALEQLGISYLISVSGKGYHIIYSLPLYLKNGRYNPAYLEILKLGGHVQSETIGWLVKTSPKTLYPRPVLAQKLHQGIYKLQHHLIVNLIPKISLKLKKYGFNSQVSLTDDKDKTLSIDLTKLIDRIDNSCFGTVGSIYSKKLELGIFRIVRKRDGKDFFIDHTGRFNYQHLEKVRRNIEKVKRHLDNISVDIPESEKGWDIWIKRYKKSKIQELHQQYEKDLDSKLAQQFINSNYKIGRDLGFSETIDGGDKLKNPAYLLPLFEALFDKAKLSPYEISCFLYGLYIDPYNKVYTEYPISKAERAKWPLLLLWKYYLD